MASGVFLGANRPNQMVARKSGRPASSMVGTSGSKGSRRRLATASARSLPAFTCGAMAPGTTKAARDLARQQVLQHRRAAAIGHVVQLGAGLLLEQADGEMRHGAEAGRADVDAAGRLLRRRDEGGERRDVELGRIDHQHVGHAGDRADRSEVAAEVEVRPGIDLRRIGEAGIAQQQRVAVGRRAGRHGGAHGAAGAALVVDHDRLLEAVGHRRGDGAREGVRTAARRIGNDPWRWSCPASRRPARRRPRRLPSIPRSPRAVKDRSCLPPICGSLAARFDRGHRSRARAGCGNVAVNGPHGRGPVPQLSSAATARPARWRRRCPVRRRRWPWCRRSG